ncbi:MAG: MarR family transcriptional regulator [Myxococcales bacterium]|nr:MarR family transcriptional regulator [Myxococcales bacterium]
MSTLKPQDVLVALKLATPGAGELAFAALAEALGISPSEAHAAFRRAAAAGLVRTSGAVRRPVRAALVEFLVHGLKYVFVPERGGLTRGMPTAHAAPPLRDQITQGDDPPPVWPAPDGEVRGQAFEPLYRSAPGAARRDPELYALLALADAIRAGRARERALAVKALEERLAK